MPQATAAVVASAEAVVASAEAGVAYARFDAERRARIAAEGELGATTAALAEAETRLRDVENELQLQTRAQERELAEARSAADRASRAKTAFLANMSHEIRTPVSAVMGYANLIAATEQANAETREWSKRLQRSAEHLLALLDDVLDLAKIDAGRLDLHLVPTEPTTVLEEVGVLMEPRAVERGLELIVVSETELPARIRTDPLRLRQILINLVGNAVKYTPSGQVALHAKMREVEGASELVLEVIDTGVGIGAADLERLFLPFEQVEQRGTRARAGGVGLGLDIARRLARMLGGDISVRSVVGVGSTFTLTLPIDQALTKATTPARLVTRSGLLRPDEAESARLDGCNVLLVDDTDDNRRIVAHFLGGGGARVIEAASLAEAFERLAGDTTIGLVLTDLQLPDGDGLELVRALRAQGDKRPVVALTADAMVETRSLALSAGVDDFIVKPIIGNRLVARLAALFHHVLAEAGHDALAHKTRPVTPRPTLARQPSSPTLPTLPVPAAPAVATRPPESVGQRRPSDPRFAATTITNSPRRAVTSQHARPGQGAPPEVPPDLLQKFYAVLAERVYVMEDAVRSKERVRLRDVAHRVAGSGSTMGHPELTELGRMVETTLNEGVAWEQLEPLALRFLTASREAASKRPWMK